jgi:predicted HTH transcriptional regulator
MAWVVLFPLVLTMTVLSVSQRTVERDLSTLKELGVLKHEGKDNDGKWIIIKKMFIRKT